MNYWDLNVANPYNCLANSFLGFQGHAIALISNLKGDRRKRRLVIEKFIAALSSKR
jgi:hypothetical protein